MTEEERKFFFDSIRERVTEGLEEEEDFEFIQRPKIIELDKTQYRILEEINDKENTSERESTHQSD